jgi:hypothetical protein
VSDQQRTCWFCGASGPLTQEHIWPAWTAEVIPNLQGPPYDLTEEFRTSEADSSQRAWARTTPVDETVGRVCASCNNGWMSELEVAVRPYLEPMIRGESGRSGPAGQVTVSAWATKTAMVLEARWPPEQIVTDEADRSTLMREQRPPANTYVRLFCYNGEHLSAAKRHVAVVGRKGEDVPTDRGNYAVTTMHIGKAGVQVIVDRSGWHPLFSPVVQATADSVTVWPPGQGVVEWPPRECIADSDVDAFQRAMLPADSKWVDE